MTGNGKFAGLLGALFGSLVLLFCFALSPGGEAQARSLDKRLQWGERQFLNKDYYPLWTERYENYGLFSYRDFGRRGENPTYDPLGSYLLDGVDLLRVEEYRSLAPERGSRIIRGNLETFRNLVIMRDQYKSWSNRVMIGDALEARFTSLTLDKARLQGLRWDGSSYKNQFSLIGSRVSSPVGGGTSSLPFATYLYGGHWVSRLGDIASFGASYTNLHLADSMQESGSPRGSFPNSLTPATAFFLIISDDSPGDASGVAVYDVEIYVDGARVDIQPDIRRVPLADLEDVDHRVDVEKVPYMRRREAWAPHSVSPAKLLEEGTGLFDTEGIAIPPGRGPVMVEGVDLLVYRFEPPPNLEAENLRFRVHVAGDYSIDVGSTGGWEGIPGRSWIDWHNVRRAEGNVGDGSNRRWETVGCGFPVGIIQYGGNLRVELSGLEVDAEYVENAANFQFPRFGGDAGRERTRAYFVKLRHQAKNWNIGAEYFDIPETYKTSLPFWSYSAQRTLTYDLIDDNDDQDEWPDVWEHWDPLDLTYIALKNAVGVDPETQPPQVTKDHLGIGNTLVGYGVYPGLDGDNDGVIDTNINRNQLPDYAEPFLMYAVESDDFVYGDDFNNNGIVDVRENDNKPNYPYELDSRGHHVFGISTPVERLSLRLGRYRVRQPAGDGRNRTDYGEARYTASQADVGRLELNYRLKRVRDNIPDPVYQHVVDPLSRSNSAVQIKPDLLLMKNSWVNTFFAKARYAGMRELNFASSLKYDLNMRRDRRPGSDDGLHDWTFVSKADYTYRVGQLTIMPMAKFLMHKRTSPRDLLVPLSTYEAFPIIRLDYQLGSGTTLRGGVQGLPGLAHRFRDLKSHAGDFDARHYLLVYQTHSNYVGYRLSMNLGFRMSRTTFTGLPMRRVLRFREFFIQAWVV